MAASPSGNMSPGPGPHGDTPDASLPSDPQRHSQPANYPVRHDSIISTITTTTTTTTPVRDSYFRSRAPSAASSTTSSVVKRKPLPATASPLATRFSIPQLPQQHQVQHERLPSTSEEDLADLEEPSIHQRAFSLDSPILHEFPQTVVRPFSTTVSELPRSDLRYVPQEGKRGGLLVLQCSASLKKGTASANVNVTEQTESSRTPS